MLTYVTDRQPGDWRPPVVRAVATAEGGVGELVEALGKHRDWLTSSGEGERRRVTRVAHEIRSIALAVLTERLGLRVDDPRLLELAGQVSNGDLDVVAAADLLARTGT
jgi:LAO/AO transport system kinase